LGYPYELWTYKLLVAHVRQQCVTAGHPALRQLSRFKLHKILRQGELRRRKIRYYSLERAALDHGGGAIPGLPRSLRPLTSPTSTPSSTTALRSCYEQFRGKIHIDRYEIIDPQVQETGDIAVLTFRFDSHGSEGSTRWNTTV
jgi:hypothetical protein